MQKIGIVGFGVVGKSAYNFFKKKQSNYKINIWDERISKTISLQNFLQSNDFNLISPGVTARQYKNFYEKFPDKIIGELDLFCDFYKKTTIAVTGSLGKTTITKLIEFLFSYLGKKVLLGGNIGTAMLDLLENAKKSELALLELSSFQLFLNRKFAPDIAVWNNFYPNHLNWHEDLNEYFFSKFKILQFQNSKQSALIGLNLFSDKKIRDLFSFRLDKIKSKIHFVSQNVDELKKINRSGYLNNHPIFYLNKNDFCLGEIYFSKINNVKKIFNVFALPKVTFIENWLFVLATIYLHGFDISKLESDLKKVINKKELLGNFVAHRLEHFATINKIDFYNDSKSTVIQSTRRALVSLDKKKRPIILILGGLDKGVDKSIWIKRFRSEFKNLKQIYAFGPDCKNLKVDKYFSDTEKLSKDLHNVAQVGDIVLFSPGGSSFDLFKNYVQRGENFKKLVLGEYGQFQEQTQK